MLRCSPRTWGQITVSIEWLDHTADVAFRVTGNSVDDVFCEAARAVFSIMFSLDDIRPHVEKHVELFARSLPDLLVEWLSELLAEKDLSGVVFSRFEAAISGGNASGFVITGQASGEPFDRERHRPGTEVKGISLLGLDVSEHDHTWVAQVVVDV